MILRHSSFVKSKEYDKIKYSNANVDNSDHKVMSIMAKEVFGKLFGDKGYIDQKFAEYLWNDVVELIYKRRKNM